METMKQMFLGKEVWIWPTDPHKKFGKVIDINDAGMIFEITRTECEFSNSEPLYQPGDIIFVAYNVHLNIVLVK